MWRDNHKPSNSSEAVARGIAATTQLDKNGRNKAQIFRFNPGKQKVIFPPKHPYFSKNCGNCKYKKYAYDKNKPDCEVCKIIHDQSFEEIRKTFQNLSYKERYTFAKNYLKQNKVGKVSFSHPVFGSRKAEFTTKTIDEAIRQPAAFDIKFDILFNIEEYLDPEAELTIESPKDNKVLRRNSSLSSLPSIRVLLNHLMAKPRKFCFVKIRTEA